MFLPTEDLLLKSGPTWHGTAIGWDSSVDSKITKIPVISERFCGVRYTENSHIVILAYSAYLPTSGKDDDFVETISQLTSDIYNNNVDKKNTAILIGLDSNQSDGSTSRRTIAMKSFISEFSLKTIIPDDKATFHHNNQVSESQIDHILYFLPETSQDITVNFSDHLCKKEHSSNLSSHDVIVGLVSLQTMLTEDKEEDYSKLYSDFKRKKPKWNDAGLEGYQTQTAEVLNEIMNDFNEPFYIPALSEMFSKTLVISAEQNFECSQPVKKKKKANFPKFSSELTEAYQYHKHICKEWRAAGRPSDKQNPLKIQKLQSQRNLQQISRSEQTIKAINAHNELMETHNTSFSDVFKKLEKIRGNGTKSTDIPFINTLAGLYSGKNVLEGFCRNTEILCNEDELSDKFDNTFYNMCVEDNSIIFELSSEENVKIPPMQIKNLKDILFKTLKLGKACDIFMLTVEHLRYAGDVTLNLLLDLLNRIISNLNYLSSPQLNTSVASIVHKGKDRPVTLHKSYRQVRVTVLIGRLLDEYIRPIFLKAYRPIQSIDQYGFTQGVTYLMGALQRHEAEQHCLDMKKTFFGCSLDGDSAFEVVNRDILTRELYMSGDRGDYWKASYFSYKDSLSRIKMNGQLSRPIKETLGVKQGHIKSSDHYTAYNGPLLDTLERVSLGVWIGPINCGVTGVADDDFLMSDDSIRLQGLIDIAEHYGKRYRITYGASKTKITISGSDIDRKFYGDTTPWSMGGVPIEVVENNDHLGQIVSGENQVIKNVDNRIKKGRGSLYKLLGPAFAYKCLLSPLVKLHLYRIYTCPILRSGLASFTLREPALQPLAIFQRKTLRSILKLSKTSCIPALFFLTGELPIQGKIHRDVFSIFYSIWRNPNTKIHEIVKYLLKMSTNNSRTWSIFLRQLSRKYDLPDPSDCLKKDAPSKSEYKELTITKITAFYEKELRQNAQTNSSMKYLNVSVTGLRGRHHPALSDQLTTLDVQKGRPYLKMLCCDYFTYEKRADQSGGSSHCRCCSQSSPSNLRPIESTCHILTQCTAYADIRKRLLSEYASLCSRSGIDFKHFLEDDDLLCQFILDPTSLNLPIRISMKDPNLGSYFRKSRDVCFSIHNARMKILKQRAENGSTI